MEIERCQIGGLDSGLSMATTARVVDFAEEMEEVVDFAGEMEQGWGSV